MRNGSSSARTSGPASSMEEIVAKNPQQHPNLAKDSAHQYNRGPIQDQMVAKLPDIRDIGLDLSG